VIITAPFYWSIGVSALILAGGLLVFSATEKKVVDVQ